jgi:hypothetical protein
MRDRAFDAGGELDEPGRDLRRVDRHAAWQRHGRNERRAVPVGRNTRVIVAFVS